MTARPHPSSSRSLSFTLLLIVLLWIATSAGFLGKVSWFLDLFAHFRIQYAVLFAIVAIIAALQRRTRLAAIGLAGLLVNAYPVATFALADAPAGQGGTANLRVVSYNAGFWNKNYDAIGRFFESTRADVIAIQEYDAERLAKLSAFLPSYPHIAAYRPAQFSAALVSRWPIRKTATITLVPGGSTVSFAEIEVGDELLKVYGAHLNWPATPRSARLRNLELVALRELLSQCVGQCVVVGDFNLSPWSAHFTAFSARVPLRNCALGHGLAFSWPAQVLPLRIQIDQCFASDQLVAMSFETGPSLGSDHRPIIVDFRSRPE